MRVDHIDHLGGKGLGVVDLTQRYNKAFEIIVVVIMVVVMMVVVMIIVVVMMMVNLMTGGHIGFRTNALTQQNIHWQGAHRCFDDLNATTRVVL
jgi:asparagine N-glycosylation enzyme membrane subunit Stt3